MKNYYPTFFITSATLDSGKVRLVVSGSPSLDGQTACRFIFAPNVPVPQGAEASAKVVFVVGDNEIPAYGKFAQPLTLKELPKASGYLRTRLPIVCGVSSNASGPYFISWNLPRPTEYVIPL